MKKIKSPFNRVGNKYRMIETLLKKFKEAEFSFFYDVFMGGGDVSINVLSSLPNVFICGTDIERHLIGTINHVLLSKNYEEVERDIDAIIEENGLSKTGAKNEYYAYRDKFNKMSDTGDKYRYYAHFFALLSHSFNYDIRFNSDGEFNVASGDNRSSFNDSMRKNMKEASYVLRENSDRCSFKVQNFIDMNIKSIISDHKTIGTKALFYFDPPYILTDTNYMKSWDEKLEQKLIDSIEMIDRSGNYFVLSNVLSHKGKTNEILNAVLHKYSVQYPNVSYDNSNYHSERDKKSVEVLLSNF